MSGDKRKPPRGNALPEFPALREFFSGYLHQDFRDEYGSAAGAAKAFCKDASEAEVLAVQGEWRLWRAQLAHASIDEVARAARNLGAGWQPHNSDELDELGKALN